MPRFKKETFAVSNDSGASLSIGVVINVSADGDFYANLPEYLFDAFADLVDDTKANSSGVFKIWAKTYAGLCQAIKTGLRKHIEPEIIKTPVIRYNIESRVAFALDANDNIVPNAGYDGARWPINERELFGDHHAARPCIGGYSLLVGARAMMRIETRHGESVKVKYEHYYAGGSHHGKTNPAEILNSWSAMDVGRTPKEIPYSDKAALFFHNLLLGMAKLNRQIQMATWDQQDLLNCIETNSVLGGFPKLAHTQEGM